MKLYSTSLSLGSVQTDNEMAAIRQAWLAAHFDQEWPMDQFRTIASFVVAISLSQ
jgi:hypothetical protein